jgi:hypothetical protein
MKKFNVHLRAKLATSLPVPMHAIVLKHSIVACAAKKSIARHSGWIASREPVIGRAFARPGE